MSGGKAPCKPGSNPKDIKRHEMRKQKKRRQNVPKLENGALDIHSMVEKATSEILVELKQSAVVPEEMVAQVEDRLRTTLAKAVDELAQVAKKMVVNQTLNGVTR